jgi:ketosteroid isomerase-like protein
MLQAAAPNACAQSKGEKQIKAVEEQIVAAFKARNVDAIMSYNVPDDSLVIFDATGPRQYVGAKAVRKDLEAFFAMFPGPIVTCELSDMTIMTGGTLGVAHYIAHTVMTDKDGKTADITCRCTDVFRKMHGKWVIVHSHVSFPVDVATGKADFSSQP